MTEIQKIIEDLDETIEILKYGKLRMIIEDLEITMILLKDKFPDEDVEFPEELSDEDDVEFPEELSDENDVEFPDEDEIEFPEEFPDENVKPLEVVIQSSDYKLTEIDKKMYAKLRTHCRNNSFPVYEVVEFRTRNDFKFKSIPVGMFNPKTKHVELSC